MPAQYPPPVARVALHRFGDCAGLSILKAPGTVYLNAKAARAMARDLARLARSIEREAFGDSSYQSEGFGAFDSSWAAAQSAPVIRKGAGN